ncbi:MULTISPECIES: TonB-dependent siderophore receptor [unclassified Pseudomonas]|uniref:TonB-dependent siderophore receptor n=1 Tax=unclassified Pseudomonas TaxID=196821 RepID=UPI000D830BD3|nr:MULTISPECIES: TonB-dependent siderophore receptor [unclassified Pseudomonas]PYG83069.1 outer membrane receptor for ferric coprogen and ferric-rhodotorulic acid [Pseudomonas sp. RV120224-01c]PYG86265.1 outer membrane receptor for ferric coprogen and ferric-rhodotorulic acid [Pseudomonas sp. RV120224-01b]
MDLLSRYRPTLLAQAIVFGTGLSLCHQVLADEPSRRYDLPAAPLGQALDRFAEQAGISLPYDPQWVAGKQARPVSGQLPVRMALYLLLEGTGLSAVQAADGNWSLQPAMPDAGAPLSLQSTMIQGQALGNSTENTGAYITGATSVGSKVAQSIKDVPHSVSVVTRQRIEDQNLTTLTDALDKTTGVTLQKNGATGSSLGNDTNFFSRGFAVSNIQFDGGAPMDTAISGYGSISQLDLAQYDHVELLRGVDGLYSGSGNPGGTINLVRKRALGHNQLKFSASAGSWDTYRSELDVTGPLTETGNVRGRAGVAYQNNRFYYDTANMEKSLYYGSLEFDLSADTLLTVGASYQESEGIPNFGGLPRYKDGSDIGLSRKTSYLAGWGSVEEKTRQAYIKLDHNFNEDWLWTTDLTWMDMDRDGNSLFANGAVDPLTGIGSTWLNYPARTGLERKGINSYVKGGFDLFGLHHDVLLGGDYSHSDGYTVQRWGLLNFTPVDIFNPVEPVDPGSTPNKTHDNTTEKYGYYGMTRLSLSERTKLILGARVSTYKYRDTEVFFDDFGNVLSDPAPYHRGLKEQGVTTPYAGLTFELTPQWTTYVSYAETYKPQFLQVAAGGKTLDAATAKNYELGLKGLLFDERVNTSFAIYRIEQEGAAIEDTRYPPTYGASNCCFLNNGEVVSEGFDAEVSGEVLTGLELFAGYTYNHTVDKANDSTRAVYAAVTPKHLFKLWGTYRLPGELSKWKAGLGVTAQSSNGRSGTVTPYNPATGLYNGEAEDFKFVQAGYAVWASSLEYQVDAHWTAILNANNLFDKKYYQTVGTSANSNFYGEPRNFTLTVRATY